jgi:hypothetical protein
MIRTLSRTSAPAQVEPVAREITHRRVVGALRLLVAVGLLATITIQITDRVVNNAFHPDEYFSYFTIETSLINIVVFAVGGVMAWRHREDTTLFTTIRMSALAYAVVTAGVYNFLLRGVPYVGYAGLQWPNEIIHVWVPILILADWLLSPGRPALSWKAMRVVLVYPVVWLLWSLLRGAVTTIYPYPFLDPAGPGGWPSVAAYIVGLSLFLLGLSALAILYSRRRVATLTSGR